ncbi:hypothetical protein EDD99_4483 [Streptomyces sp. 846.5]|nr:hypothetical protein [Streptomyces sp. 846.5]TDU05942.1 hypothetical protein EDD99_4483 [Streptomyces sp. 846.5]
MSPFPVVDPAAPTDMSPYNAKAPGRARLHRNITAGPWLQPLRLKLVGATALAVAVVVLDSIPGGNPAARADPLGSLLSNVRLGAAGAMMLTLYIAARGIREWRAAESERWTAARARPHVVLREDLTPRAAALVERAHRAAQAVTATRVHTDDLIDRRGNEVALPAQVWEIARTLAEHGRHSMGLPAHPATVELRQATRDRAALLNTAWQVVVGRVEGLEQYAAAAREADRSYTEWRQLQQLADGEADAQALLAPSATQELAAAELLALTAGAVAVAETFRTAVREAAAGRRALPPTTPG